MTFDSNRRLRLRTEFSIDAFATETAYVPARARSTRDPRKLPPRLESLVLVLPDSAAWCAWSEGPRSWFVQGSLGRPSQDRPDDIIVRLLFRDHDGLAVAGGIWCRSAPGRWDLLRNLTRPPTLNWEQLAAYRTPADPPRTHSP